MTSVGIELWGDMMRSKVVVYNIAPGARSPFGEATYSTQGSTYAARIIDVDGRIRQTEGFTDDVRGMAWVACKSTEAIKTNSKLVVPDGSAPSIIGVTAVRDETGGVHHMKVAFG